MSATSRIAGLATIVFALASLAWSALEVVPPILGFGDTDDPSVMIAFVRAHPDIHVFAGLCLIVMAISLTVAILGVAEVTSPHGGPVALRSLSTLGLFAAAFFLVSGGLKIGASGPLRHIAGLRQEWGETAYLVYQVAGQALLISGILGLCVWAVGLSVIGLRTGVFPAALCVLGIIPAFRLVGGTLGPLGSLPGGEILWVLGMISIPGTMVWCLLLGIVLLHRGIRSMPEHRVAPGVVGG